MVGIMSVCVCVCVCVCMLRPQLSLVLEVGLSLIFLWHLQKMSVV